MKFSEKVKIKKSQKNKSFFSIRKFLSEKTLGMQNSTNTFQSTRFQIPFRVLCAYHSRGGGGYIGDIVTKIRVTNNTINI